MVVGSTINKHGGKELKKIQVDRAFSSSDGAQLATGVCRRMERTAAVAAHHYRCSKNALLTPDNTLYFVFRYDIYQSNWTGGEEWTEPVSVPGPINTNNNEISPVVVQNGTVMYFARYQETTDYDFYRSEWDEAKGQWGKPERVGPWNTPEQEWAYG